MSYFPKIEAIKSNTKNILFFTFSPKKPYYSMISRYQILI